MNQKERTTEALAYITQWIQSNPELVRMGERIRKPGHADPWRDIQTWAPNVWKLRRAKSVGELDTGLLEPGEKLEWEACGETYRITDQDDVPLLGMEKAKWDALKIAEKFYKGLCAIGKWMARRDEDETVEAEMNRRWDSNDSLAVPKLLAELGLSADKHGIK